MSNPEVLYVPICALYENRVQVYERNLLAYGKKKKDDRQFNSPTNKKYTGIMTKSGKKTIEKRITSWLLAMECFNRIHYTKYQKRVHMPVFITLTLSDKQKHDDYYIKRNMLQVFLKDLQYNFGVVNYFWKAERQKNKNIHFHILVDKFIDKEHIQTAWNRVQKRHGYIKKYQSEYGNENPPSTHIEGKPKNSSLVKYMLKYVSKHDNTQTIDGSVFRFSKSLLKLVPFNEIVMGGFSESFSKWLPLVSSKEFNHDFCSIHYFDKDLAIESLPVFLRGAVERYYFNLYKDIYENKGIVSKRTKESITEIPKVEQGELFDSSDYLMYTH